jgi:hypothetical protein
MEERAKARAERKSLLDAKKRALEEEKLVSITTNAAVFSITMTVRQNEHGNAFPLCVLFRRS